MKPDQPHSFHPRNPTTAEGRTTCAVCAQPADAPTHDPLDLMQRSIEETAKKLGIKARFAQPRICSEQGCRRPVWARGLCRRHDGKHEVVTFTAPAGLLAMIDRAALAAGASRSAWLRELVSDWMASEGRAFGADAPGHADQQVPEG